MPFNSETGREAGKKSKRGKSKYAQEIREFLDNFIYKYLTQDQQVSFMKDFAELSPRLRVKAIADFMPYLLAKVTADQTIGIESDGNKIKMVFIPNDGDQV